MQPQRNITPMPRAAGGRDVLADVAEPLFDLGLARPDDPFQVGPALEAAVAPDGRSSHRAGAGGWASRGFPARWRPGR